MIVVGLIVSSVAVICEEVGSVLAIYGFAFQLDGMNVSGRTDLWS